MTAKRHPWWQAFRSNLIVGLGALLPVALTVGILVYLYGLLVSNRFTVWIADRILHLWPLEMTRGWRAWVLERLARVMALLAILLGIVGLGFLTRNVVGRRLYRFGERLLESIPLVNRIYGFLRSLAHAIFFQRQVMFREVVAVEFPRSGVYSVAFVTAHTPIEFGQDCVGRPERLLVLFVPTTPNPTSGFLIFVPPSQVRRLRLTTTEAMALILSGGTIYPSDGALPLEVVPADTSTPPGDAAPTAVPAPSPRAP